MLHAEALENLGAATRLDASKSSFEGDSFATTSSGQWSHVPYVDYDSGVVQLRRPRTPQFLREEGRQQPRLRVHRKIQRLATEFSKERGMLHGTNCNYNLEEASLFCFNPQNSFRRRLFLMVDSDSFDRFILLCIVLNCIALILGTPGLQEMSGVQTMVDVAEIVFQTIFTIEMIVKILALGFVLHEHSYLRSMWNRIDFAIVVLGFVTFFFSGNFSAIRMIRVLRPLRAVSKVPELAALVKALINALPRMRDALLLLLFVLMIFSILGLQLFVGQFSQRCYAHRNASIYDLVQYNVSVNETAYSTANPQWEVVPVLVPFDTAACSTSSSYGHQCPANSSCEVHKDIYKPFVKTFDNIFTSMIMVFKIVSMDNWPMDLRVLQSTKGFAMFAFGFVLVLIGTFFTVNLILAILSSEYEAASAEAQADVAEESEESSESSDSGGDDSQSATLRSSQSMFSASASSPSLGAQPTMVVVLSTAARRKSSVSEADFARRKRKRKKTTSCWVAVHKAVFDFVQTDVFNAFMMFVTIVNVIALAIDFHNIPPKLDQILGWINFGCSITFILEMLLKIYGLGVAYFYDGFNRFDFILVMISIPEMVISGAGSGSAFSALRAFRLARVLRVIKASKSVRVLLITVIRASAGAAYIFLLLLLFLLVTSLVGVNLFSDSYPEGARPHFRNLGDAAIAVFIVITGENWMDVTEEAMRGSNWGAFFYFIFVFCIGNYIVLNLFVALLIAAFASAAPPEEDEEEQRQKQMMLAQQTLKIFSALGKPAAAASVNPLSPQALQLSTSAVNPTATPLTTTAGPVKAEPTSKTPPNANPPPKKSLLEKRISFTAQAFEKKGLEEAKPSTTSKGVHFAGEFAVSHSPRPRSPIPNGGLSMVSIADIPQVPEERFCDSGREQLDSTGDPLNTSNRQLNSSQQERSKSFVQTVEEAQRGFQEDRIRKASAAALSAKERNFKIELLEGNSLCIFGPKNSFRVLCGRLLYHPAFDWFIVFMIFASCVMLFLDYPGAESNEILQEALWWTDLIFLVVFIFEAALHAVVEGMILGEKAYLSDSWNRLDFIVVIASIVGIFFPVAQMLRSLRSFKLAAKSESLRLVISSLFHALPSVGNMITLVLFVFIVFGILGVQLFKGAFVQCNDPDVLLREECILSYNVTSLSYVLSAEDGMITTSTTVSVPREWQFTFFNFNHLGYALLCLFALAMNDGWSVILWQAMDSTDFDHAMTPYARPYMALYVIVFVIVGTFFMMNLFIGSLIDSFNRERDKKEGKIDEEGSPLLTERQLMWLRAYQVARATELPHRPPEPENALRRWCCNLYFADERRLAARHSFEWTVTILIIVNALVMCLQYDGMPKSFEDALFWTNLGFAILYTIEAAIKLIALLPPGYFMDGWNRFDFALVVLAYVSMFVGGPGANSLRVLRVGRVLRLIKRAEGLQRLFNALLYAIPQLINVTLLLVLCLFIFGVLGTKIFGRVIQQPDYPDSALDEYFNFRHAGNSIILLFQISTTEGWWDVLRSCMVKPGNSPCSYDDNNCGTDWAIVFFVCFMIAANAVCLNLFIFVIVDKYGEVQQLSKEKAARCFALLEKFKESWIEEDPELSETLLWKDLIKILRQLPPEFGFSANQFASRFLKRLRMMDIPISPIGMVTYQDCIQGFTRDAFGLDSNSTRIAAKLLENAKHTPEDEESLKVHHGFVALRLQEKVIERRNAKHIGKLVKKRESFVLRAESV